MEDLLTEHDYIEILKSKYKSKDLQFVSAEWKNLDAIEGFMGDHYFLSIKYKDNAQEKVGNFFIKTKPMKTEVQKSMADKFNIYEKEIFFYNFLLKEFERLGYQTDFAAKSHLCKDKTTIVMDDMNESGFELKERGTFFDMEHCMLGLEALAKYHANGISYEEHKSKELGRPYRFGDEIPGLFEEVFYNRNDTENSRSSRFINRSKDLYIEVSKTMPESENWKKSFEEKLMRLDLPEIFWKEFPYRRTVCHGDLWSNNMMFKYQNSVPKEICLLDFQLIRHYYPSLDPLLLIFSNTSRNFRQQHFNELLDYYYTCFEKYLARNGYNASQIFPKSHFLEVAESIKIISAFQGACTRTITLLPKDITTDAVNSGGDGLEDLFFENKRTKLILEACRKDEKFKKIIFDDIYEIDQCLK